MSENRKTHNAITKAKAAMEAVQGYYTVNELARKYEVHPTQLSQWKKTLLTEAHELFSDKRSRKPQHQETQETRLYEEIGRLKMELDWLKKKTESIGPGKTPIARTPAPRNKPEPTR